MTVSSTSNKSGPYVGNNSLRDWPIDFDTNGVDESEVYGYLVSEDGVSTLIEENYEVDLNALTFTYPTVASGLPPLTTNERILLVRILDIVQESDFRAQGSFNAESFEEALDRWAMICQQIQEQVDRSAKGDISGSEQDEDTVALLNLVNGARDEATLAAADASAYSDLASASAISAMASAASAATYASAASDSADDAAASALSAATYAQAAEDSADSASASAISASALAAAFTIGSPTSKTIDGIYQAATNGFVCGYIDLQSGEQVILYTDSSYPPTTPVTQASVNVSGTYRFPFCYPIKKNDYYNLTTISGTISPYTFNFVPIGT